MSDRSPVHLTPSGPPETVLDAEPADAVSSLTAALALLAVHRRDAVSAVVARHPRFLETRAPQVGTAQQDPDASLTGGGGVEMVARLDARTTVKAGSPATPSVDVGRLNLFDQADGLAIRG